MTKESEQEWKEVLAFAEKLRAADKDPAGAVVWNPSDGIPDRVKDLALAMLKHVMGPDDYWEKLREVMAKAVTVEPLP